MVYYEIKIKGQLDSHWSEWFEDLTMTYDEGGNTLLSGHVTDQAALYGLLNKARNMNLALISVNRIDPNPNEDTRLVNR